MGFWADIGVAGQEEWDLTTGVTLVWIYLKNLLKEVPKKARPIHGLRKVRGWEAENDVRMEAVSTLPHLLHVRAETLSPSAPRRGKQS